MYRADFQYKHYKVMYEKHGKKLKLHIYFYTNIYTHVPSQISVQVKKIYNLWRKQISICVTEVLGL